MKIGIISDTHSKKHTEKIEEFINNNLNNIDILIHAGDFKSYALVKQLKKYKNFIGVWGNNDGKRIREELKEKEIIIVNGYKIGIFHGHGGKKSTLDSAYTTFINDKVDIIIFGHSHQPLLQTKNKILLINPGSLAMKRKERWYTYVILDITKNCIKSQTIFLNKL